MNKRFMFWDGGSCVDKFWHEIKAWEVSNGSAEQFCVWHGSSAPDWKKIGFSGRGGRRIAVQISSVDILDEIHQFLEGDGILSLVWRYKDVLETDFETVMDQLGEISRSPERYREVGEKVSGSKFDDVFDSTDSLLSRVFDLSFERKTEEESERQKDQLKKRFRECSDVVKLVEKNVE